jgi:hypothetical protein
VRAALSSILKGCGSRRYGRDSGGHDAAPVAAVLSLARSQVLHGISSLVIPAKAGIYFCSGHRPSPV